jgi:RimJ/RimL family protein N-acetyltransferase
VFEPLISSPRLELHHIPVDGLIALLDDKSDLLAIAARDFTNPFEVLIADEGPLPWRVPQVKVDPALNRWFIRFIVLRDSREIIGSISFHSAPDAEGMIEIGLGIEEKFWGRGFAKEALLGMWRWVVDQAGVKTLRYTVSPTNIASIKVIEYFGFSHIGQQMDEIDGPEDIYEMSVEDFRKKWGSA